MLVCVVAVVQSHLLCSSLVAQILLCASAMMQNLPHPSSQCFISPQSYMQSVRQELVLASRRREVGDQTTHSDESRERDGDDADHMSE